MKICITWDGLASYAEASIKKFIAITDHDVSVVASVPEVPKTTGDSILGVAINWIPRRYEGSIKDIIGAVPDVLVQGGWFLPAFSRFGDEVRKNGGKVVVAIDNQFIWGWKLLPWILRFVFKFRRKFDGYLIPGKSTAKLLRWCGVPKWRIAQGLYTADPQVFTNGGPLERRPKKMLYIGRFIGLKNVIRMLQAFADFAREHPDWELHCYGQGNLQQEMERIIGERNCKSIVLHEFVQPVELAELYKQARVLVLPSLWDHWGVVVHEATLSGCALLVSDRVGVGWNLCTKSNGLRFNPFRKESLHVSLSKIADWDDAMWRRAQNESLRVAKTVSPDVFASELAGLICRLS